MLTLLVSLALALPLGLPDRPQGHVNDFANLLGTSAIAELEAKLARHEETSSNQVVVVTLPSLEGADISDVTIAIGKAWGIGQRGRDNGVVFAIAKSDRKMRIEVGKGLEGALTDLETHVIQEDVVRPAFRAGDYAGGIKAGTDAIIAAITGEFTAPEPPKWQGWMFLALFAALFAGPIAFFVWLWRRPASFWSSRGGGTASSVDTVGGGSDSSWSSSDSSSSSSDFSGGGGDFGGGGSSSDW